MANQGSVKTGVVDKPRDYEFEYYGLLHILKDLSFELKMIRDVVPNKDGLEHYITAIDHEIAKASNRKESV